MGRQKDRQVDPRPEDLRQWSAEELMTRIRRCRSMEEVVKANKARRGWKKAAEEGEAELTRRGSGDV
jgi:hypothetical protein